MLRIAQGRQRVIAFFMAALLAGTGFVILGPATQAHVAWVEAVSSNGSTVTIEDYNSKYNGLHDMRTIQTSSVTKFLHLGGEGGGASGGTTAPDGYYHGTPPDGMIVQSDDMNNWYVAFGGSLIWFDRSVAWVREDLLAERDRRFVWMNAPKMTYDQIHAIEYGYGGNRSHVPADNSFFYEAGNTQQYVVQYRYAFSIGSAEEASYLGGVNKAVMVPPGLSGRLAGVPDIPNDVILKAVSNPTYYHMVNGAAYWANNFTVIDCIQTVKGGHVQPVPWSLVLTLDNYGRINGQPTHCSFPPNWALYGPGGAERWWVDGANPYTRHHYGSSLALHCRLGSNPIEVQLPDTAGINQPTELEPLDCPNNTFVRIAGNGETYQVVDGILHYVMSPSGLACLTNGHPEVVIDIDGGVVATTPRGSNAYCTFEGKMIQSPSGQVDYVKGGTRHHVLNAAIVNCLKGRVAAGDPIVVDQSLFDSYGDSGATAYCPYELAAGVNFVQENGDPTVWVVGPPTTAGQPGVKRHAGSLCVPDPYTTGLTQYRVSVVPSGEVAGHVQGPDFWASGPACQALPQG